eukprot:TRINITY_DN9259_c0_g1_i1.p1 TRINITY_DN9259_c0_g1~~TRINITY_DN9259_c0_g1_i1.p1  ORF type:complete len:280 (-),score=79.60 TRINITY_DN9259_c0_g1_i1:22-807(-)
MSNKDKVDDEFIELEDTPLFEDPDGFYKPPPKETIEKYSRKKEGIPHELSLRLVGSHPLWAHYLWNAGIILSDYLDQYDFTNKNVLELGAGAALPSLVVALNKPKKVVITDYPDQILLDNIQHNVKNNLPLELQQNIVVVAHLWGKQPEELLKYLDEGEKFDVVILSDLVFNHLVHKELLISSSSVLREDGKGEAFVSFSHHRPSLAHKDLEFFETAPKYGFHSEKLFDKLVKPMFEKDFGPEEVRATVHFYKKTLKKKGG